MYFSESETLANDNPDLSEEIRQIDAYLFQSDPSTLLLARRVASALNTSRTKTASILHLFVEANIVSMEDMVECECGTFAPLTDREPCSSCSEQRLDTNPTKTIFRLTKYCSDIQQDSRAKESEVIGSSKTNRKGENNQSALDKHQRDALSIAYSGIWGSKVIWLAAFTFAPLVIGLKISFLRISVGLATAVYLAYHALGALNWIRLRQLQQAPQSHNETDTERIWRYIALRHKAAVPLSYIVLALLLLTIVAKVDFTCAGNTQPICLPTTAYSIVAVSPPSTCVAE